MGDLQRVGTVLGGQGSAPPFTASITGASRTNDAHGRYADPTRKGRVFILDSDAVTLAAANVTKSAMGTVKFINGFFNPAASGINAEIIRALVATTSGTPGGPYFYGFFRPSGTLTSALTGTIRNKRLYGPNSAMQALVNVAIATTPADTTAIIQLGVMGGPAAVAAGAGLYTAIDEPASSIIVPPGVLFGLVCAAAGTSHVVQSSLEWEEVPALQDY